MCIIGRKTKIENDFANELLKNGKLNYSTFAANLKVNKIESLKSSTNDQTISDKSPSSPIGSQKYFI